MSFFGLPGGIPGGSRQPTPPPSFKTIRLLCLCMLLMMIFAAIGIGVALQINDGNGYASEPIELLDTIAIVVAGTLTVGAVVVRSLLNRRADNLQGDARTAARGQARVASLAIVEGAYMLALVAWLLNGNAIPNLAIALVLLSIAIAMVPFQDPDTQML